MSTNALFTCCLILGLSVSSISCRDFSKGAATEEQVWSGIHRLNAELSLHPDNTDALFALANLYPVVGEKERAKQIFIDLQHRFPEKSLVISEELMNLDKFDKFHIYPGMLEELVRQATDPNRPKKQAAAKDPAEEAQPKPEVTPKQQMQQQMMGPTIVIGGQTVSGDAAVKIKEFGMVVFESTPQGAEIYVERNLVGNTPTTQLRFEKGIYNISLKKKGFRDWTRQIMVIENSTVTIQAELEIK